MKKRITKKLVKRCRGVIIVYYDGYRTDYFKWMWDFTYTSKTFIITSKYTTFNDGYKFRDFNKVIRQGEYIIMYKRCPWMP